MVKLYASWTHGNSLVAENPENIASSKNYGWGNDITVKQGKGGWFHISIPTPVIVGDVRSEVRKCFVMFSADGGAIKDVHLYDGLTKVQAYDGLNNWGDHRGGLDGQNTFVLPQAHTVVWGMGLSFFYQSTNAVSTLRIASAGCDFYA